MEHPVRVGAVAYSPNVKAIWDLIKAFFDENGCPVDYVLYRDYDLQVGALAEGRIDVAWNSPLAWIDLQRRVGGACRALAMRDTDRDRTTHIVIRRDAGIESVEGLRGKTVATGAADSPQAYLLPLHLLRSHGLVEGRDFEVQRHDVGLGLHGDHVGGERDALQSLLEGRADACCVLDLNWETWQADGTADPNLARVLASTGRFDHCNFSVLEAFPRDVEERWTNVLLQMSYDVPEHRRMMDMEGLKAWQPGRATGYGDLDQAVRELDFFATGAQS
jgi:ABC-type phosphate/phosphonate transport system substrate-binding protein